MGEKILKVFNLSISALLIFQLTGCGTLLYPERRGQMSGRLDAGVVILDALGLLFFIIPGIIAFAVDFGNGTIYLPTRRVLLSHDDLIIIKYEYKKNTIDKI